MNMENLAEIALQYGIAGVALWMMYSITYNHLVSIESTLLDIKHILMDILAKDL